MKTVILGAGIGGLCTAIALRLKGIDCEVYEKYATISDMGAGIICWPNASFVLDQLGMLDEVKTISGKPRAMRRLTHEGENIGMLDISALNASMGYASYSIFRKDLMKILYTRAMGLGVTIHFSQKIDKITSGNNNGSTICLSNEKIINADIVIAADGRMNSVARKYVHGNNVPKYQGFINWVGKLTASSSIVSDMSVMDCWGVGQRFGIVPINRNAAYWAGAIAAPAIEKTDSNNYRDELLTLFAHWPTPIAEIINKTPSNNIHKIYVHDHDPISVWHRNNVIIIGDAAHAPLPTSGQGACQAMEDAWQLATLLGERDTTQDIDTVYKKFTHLRVEKTRAITHGARQFANSLFNVDPEYCAQRNQMSKSTDFSQMVSGMAQGWAKGLPLNTTKEN
ncbi:MAG: FAD-dependent monooxygenase [Thiohalomonadales bacterium]